MKRLQSRRKFPGFALGLTQGEQELTPLALIHRFLQRQRLQGHGKVACGLFVGKQRVVPFSGPYGIVDGLIHVPMRRRLSEVQGQPCQVWLQVGAVGDFERLANAAMEIGTACQGEFIMQGGS